MVHGYWKQEKGANVREFFVRFAQRRNFDPLVAENWYSIHQKDIVATKVIDFYFHFLFILLFNVQQSKK
jgi:hypothetical protein